jgi:hypothetical protein
MNGSSCTNGCLATSILHESIHGLLYFFLSHFILQSVINKTTVNQGNTPEERSIKEIELFFDASLKNDEFVLTYDTVHRNVSKHKVNFDHKVFITI